MCPHPPPTQSALRKYRQKVGEPPQFEVRPPPSEGLRYTFTPSGRIYFVVSQVLPFLLKDLVACLVYGVDFQNLDLLKITVSFVEPLFDR